MAYGDLGAVIDSVDITGLASNANDIVKALGQIFAVIHGNGTGNHWIRTISIDELGEISDTYLDLIHVPFQCIGLTDHIVMLTDNICVAITRDENYHICLTTCFINADGSINDPVLDSHAFTEFFGVNWNILKLSPGYVAIAAHDQASNNGYLLSAQIYGTGEIEEDLVDSIQFEDTRCDLPYLVKVHSGIYAVVYRGPDVHGWVKTVAITGTGIFGLDVIDEYEFTSVAIGEPVACLARDNFIAVTYGDPDSDGHIVILEIDPGGAITKSLIDDYEFEPVGGGYYSIYSIGQGYLGIAYRKSPGGGHLKSFYCDENGSLNDTTIDTLQYDATNTGRNTCAHGIGDVWAVGYCDGSRATSVRSYGLETPPPPPRCKDLMRGALR